MLMMLRALGFLAPAATLAARSIELLLCPFARFIRPRGAKRALIKLHPNAAIFSRYRLSRKLLDSAKQSALIRATQ